jgi:hypothetical protein
MIIALSALGLAPAKRVHCSVLKHNTAIYNYKKSAGKKDEMIMPINSTPVYEALSLTLSAFNGNVTWGAPMFFAYARFTA